MAEHGDGFEGDHRAGDNFRERDSRPKDWAEEGLSPFEPSEEVGVGPLADFDDATDFVSSAFPDFDERADMTISETLIESVEQSIPPIRANSAGSLGRFLSKNKSVRFKASQKSGRGEDGSVNENKSDNREQEQILATNGHYNGSFSESQPTQAPQMSAKRGKLSRAGTGGGSSAGSEMGALGLKIQRYYTRPGEDVWKTVEWEIRTASIVGEKGDIVFKQDGVEFPKTWSQMATNVAASKYFRGQVGTLEREFSIKQLIGRVADTFLKWGKQGGYFATDEDASAFHDELRYILLHQLAAFNSPVWFNLGWPGRRQAISACYINEVNDSMESILDLYKTEGMLFKDGSGSGVNLSTLRSSREPLAAGGRSSGPVSFMKGLDASAGSIKSGGSTRRAACMRVLDVDHPDVIDFINCKRDAEEKAHALIEAGYSGAFNVPGGAYDTVPFQNANHSVRVSDEFMQAVADDAAWETKHRMTGKSEKSFKAREIIQKIAEATWVCGDPGMQYDTTINNWHTCAEADRIYASNPCVTGDTLVATADGWHRIDDLVGQSVNVIGADGQPHFVTRVIKTGHKPVFELRTRAGYRLRLTEDHKVLTRERGDVELKDVKLGESVFLKGAGFGRRALSETLALAIGLAVGDGCLIRQSIRGRDNDNVVLTLSQEEKGTLDRVAAELNGQKNRLREVGISGNPSSATIKMDGSPGVARLTVGSRSVVNLFTEFAVLNAGSAAKAFTSDVFDLDKPSMAAVLRGLFTADGTVANYGDKSQYISLDSTSSEMLGQVQTMLLSFGIKSKLYENRRGGILESMLPDSQRQPKSYAVKEMHSLRISRSSRVIFEREIGFDHESPKAERLRVMNQTFAAYADDLSDSVASITPIGLEDVYDLTEPVTSHFVAGGIVVHNCSEYMFLNSTACNLSSLNLMLFRDNNGAFDVDSFEHAIRIMITAMEIGVGFAEYPTPKITERSHDYRTLGLGYANLGALLMASGLPYDSDQGRSYAAALTSIMTGTAYAQSAAASRYCGGPFAGFAKNRNSMIRVMKQHRDAVEEIDNRLVPAGLVNAARISWDEALAVGEQFGYRNAQATVLAPTGTIGFLMDCDTTGVEPDIAIVKYKSLVGGGMMKIVNQTVPEALRNLGYSGDAVNAILDFIDKNDTIEGAPELNKEHLPVFDCAFRPTNGTRTIHYQGHIKMMAAVQPFISGAISKTVNVPEDATPGEIAKTYIEAWQLGLKAIAIYRDGSKKTQPLSTKRETTEEAKQVVAPVNAVPMPVMESMAGKPIRKKLPDERPSITHKFSVGGHEGYITVGLYPDTQMPGEIFVTMSKEGSTISGLMDGFATAISLALQYGVPVSTLVNKFIHSRFEPSGFTNNKEIPMAKSVMDYIFRWMALKFLQKEERNNVGLIADQAMDTVPGAPSTGSNPSGSIVKALSEMPTRTPAIAQTQTDREREVVRFQSDAPPCPECGALTIRSGACYKCMQCGTSLGCS